MFLKMILSSIWRRSSLILVLAGLVPGSSLFAAPADDDLLARGKGIEVRLKELTESFDRLQTTMVNAGTIPAPETVEGFKAQILDRLILSKLFETRASDQDRKRAQFESNASVEGMRNQASSPQEFEKQLTRSGHTLATFQRERFLEALANNIVDRELKATIKPETAELNRRYEESPDRWIIPETIRVAQLLISTRNSTTGEELPEESRKTRLQQIDELRARTMRGEEFTALIRQYSDDLASKTRKGEYIVTRGQMLIEFEAAAFSLKPGQLSDVVSTQLGYHLIKLLDRTPEKRRSFEDAEPVLRAQWISEELNRRLPEYLQNLRKEAAVELTPLAPKPIQGNGS